MDQIFLPRPILNQLMEIVRTSLYWNIVKFKLKLIAHRDVLMRLPINESANRFVNTACVLENCIRHNGYAHLSDDEFKDSMQIFDVAIHNETLRMELESELETDD
ncbi:unnamed protein product [Caenorhabditis sp. 36 PRJEB53466]|nr:unnamed protein product [Caenorhabditis sp. 36 PRJEB53466]